MPLIPDDKNLANMDLRGVDWSKANLARANLEHANLAGALLRQASLSQANLSGANLEGADLGGAILQSANLTHANLRQATLTGIYGIWADFRWANLDHANLRGALLEAADFREASLENVILTNIDYNRATNWPKGFAPHKLIMTAAPREVVTVGDLMELLVALFRSQAIDYKGSLEEYLRSLFGVAQKERAAAPSPALFAQLLMDAFMEAPVDYEDDWRDYASEVWREPTGDDFDHFRYEIQQQIAELHLAQGGIDRDRLLRDWNNGMLEDYFGAAVRGFEAHSIGNAGRQKLALEERWIGRDLQSQNLAWQDFADMLRLGKVYE